jgi:hypothetical protein
MAAVRDIIIDQDRSVVNGYASDTKNATRVKPNATSGIGGGFLREI